MPLSNPTILISEDGGTPNECDAIDFTGDGVTVSLSGTTATVDVSSGGSSTPGGSSGQVQYNNATAFAGATNVLIDNNDLVILENAAPTAPAAGRVKLFSSNVGGRQMLSQIGPSGLDTPFQPLMARNKIAYWSPIGNSNVAPIAFGMASPTLVGNTARNVATTNLFTSMRRLGLVSASGAASSMCSARLAVTQFWRGNAANLGGFHVIVRFGTSDAATVSGARAFVGLRNATAAPTNIEPNASTMGSIIGVAQISTSNNLQIVHNDGSGTATTIDLGANFPANTLSVDVYELDLFAPPNGSNVQYMVRRLNTGHTSSGTITTDLPTNTTLLAFQMWRTNNAQTLAVGMDMMSVYIETDY